MNKARLKVKNIGPIKNIDIELNRVNVFMGPQSSGKSTLSKIICHCQWVEKQMFVDFEQMQKYYSGDGVFYSELIEYHRLDGYFMPNSSFEYFGEFTKIKYTHKTQKVEFNRYANSNYKYLKIGYIPSERNIVSAVPNVEKYNETNDVIMYFMYDWFTARSKYKAGAVAEILHKNIDYTHIDGKDFITDNKVKILLSNASSGLQSIIPLYLVISYLLSGLYKEKQTVSYKLKAKTEDTLQRLSELKSKLNTKELLDWNKEIENMNKKIVSLSKTTNTIAEQSADINEFIKLLAESNIKIPKSTNVSSFIENLNKRLVEVENQFLYKYSQLYIEEPEQNLFPDTQRHLVYRLMKDSFAQSQGHSIVLTTHSPYILFALNNCMMGGLVGVNVPMERYNDFESHGSWIDPKMVSIWEIKDGELVSIQDEDGILEDNYLNKASNSNSNEYFKLLNYYDEDKDK